MNAAIKTKWLAALRSGRYEQGKGCLRSEDNKFCCLGVLADTVQPENWTEPHSETEDGTRTKDHYCFNADYELLNLFGEDLGLDQKTQEKLAEMNDGIASYGDKPIKAGLSFAKIADWIEANL